MKSRAAHGNPGIAAAVATLLGIPIAKAEPPAPPLPDTSSWKCEQCPFFQGYTSDVEAGVLSADGANASSGRYTGIDRDGVYADVAAHGQWRYSSGSYGDYSLDSLGLPSREGYIDAGQEGRYEVKVSYDGQPTRLYDTTASPYLSPAPGQLTLPGGWVASNSTATFRQLGSSLLPVELGFDRRSVSLSGKYFLNTSWTFYANLEHQEKEGSGLIGGAFLTEAVQLPQPIDYQTNSLEVGAAWTSSIASARLSYGGSWFEDGTDSLTWANPFTPVLPAGTTGRLALPPSNNLQQVAASGEVRLPVFTATTLTYNFSYGWLGQNTPFLPASTLPGTAPLPVGSLDGDLRLTHYSLALSSRPWDRLYVRGRATYDGRDDQTTPLTLPQILTDALPNGTAMTPRYGEDRTRLEGTVDYRLFGWVRLGVGGELQSIHFSPGQVLTWMQDARSWGQVTLNPLPVLGFTIKAGNATRQTSSYNTAELALGENPLLRAFDYAPLDTNFYSFIGTWSPLATLTWALEGTWSDDAYRLTQLGLQESRDRKIDSTVTFTPVDKASVYVEGGYQRLSALQAGSIGVGAPQWYVQDSQNFWNVSAGGHWAIRERWDVGLDYVHSLSRGNDTTVVSDLPEPFPENRYHLDSFSLTGGYRVNDRLKVHLRYQHERYDTSDWALGGVGPETVPTLLALGAQPYRYTVNLISLTAQYWFDEVRSPTAQK